MAYEYRMVQVPRQIAVKSKDHQGNEAAAYLESLVGQQAQQGWEFFRVDTIGVLVQSGCLASIFNMIGNKQDQMVEHYVVTFRRAT